MAPSLALLTLLNLTPAEHEVQLVNENVEKLDSDWDADLVGITVTLDVMPRAMAIAGEFRKRGVPVVAGGIHVTCRPEDCLPHFDAICAGPAERVWARIISDVEKKRLQREYRDMEGFHGYEIASPDYRFAGGGKYLYTNPSTGSNVYPIYCSICFIVNMAS